MLKLNVNLARLEANGFTCDNVHAVARLDDLVRWGAAEWCGGERLGQGYPTARSRGFAGQCQTIGGVCEEAAGTLSAAAEPRKLRNCQERVERPPKAERSGKSTDRLALLERGVAAVTPTEGANPEAEASG